MSIKVLWREFLVNPHIKNSITHILSFALGLLISLIANCIYSKNYGIVFWVCIIIGISVLILTICLSRFYLNIDQSVNNNKAILNAFKSLGEEFKTSALNLYKDTKKARINRKLSLENWNQNRNSDFICDSLYKFICEIAERGDCFSVSIILKLIDPCDKEYKYMMISYKGTDQPFPNIYNTPVKKSDANKYFYGRLFEKNSPDPVYLMDSDEIDDNFYFSTGQNLKEYNQYIGIPICCKGDKMNALIQIIGYNDSIVSKDKEKIKEIVNNSVYVYAHYSLYCDKIEKGLLVKAKKKKRGYVNVRKRKTVGCKIC